MSQPTIIHSTSKLTSRPPTPSFRWAPTPIKIARPLERRKQTKAKGKNHMLNPTTTSSSTKSKKILHTRLITQNLLIDSNP